MKTKSKRFLNLATLCLALLGTTLLIAQPVKAETVLNRQGQEQKQANTDDSTGKNGIRSEESEQNTYQEGKSKGYQLGLRDGRKKDAPPYPSNTFPDSNPYSSNYTKKYYYKRGYEEGYVQGYYLGKSESQQD
ncbi:TPA: hypothetical protein VOR05_001748, partial [Streptococcus pyogenes]|nr:hypothetical protein [Streptococcus pyogenes]